MEHDLSAVEKVAQRILTAAQSRARLIERIRACEPDDDLILVIVKKRPGKNPEATWISTLPAVGDKLYVVLRKILSHIESRW